MFDYDFDLDESIVTHCDKCGTALTANQVYDCDRCERVLCENCYWKHSCGAPKTSTKKKEIVCECGVEVVGSDRHSTYCPKYKKDI